MKKIGFIGIGVMGGPIVQHLLHAGYEVIGYSRTKEKAAAQIEAGMKWSATIPDVVTNADIIFTMVGFPTDVEEIYLGEKGILAYAHAGQIIIDMTTSKPSLAAEIAATANQTGVLTLDAPVTGGDLGAINGTLSMMVGGDAAAFRTVEPILTIFTQTLNYVGNAGMGMHAKMANQIAICGNLIGMAESFIYARNMGIDVSIMLEIMGGGSASSWQLVNNGKKILEGNYAPGFYLKHFVKDMKIALDELKQINCTLPTLSYGYEICQKLVEDGYGDNGSQIIIKAYDRKF